MSQERRTEEEILRLENLHIHYRTSNSLVKAVNGINLSLKRGRTLGLVGETGAGKTTAALGIMGLLPERTGRIPEGKILYNGRNLLELSDREMNAIRGECISMIFQDPMTALNPVMNIGNQLREAIKLHVSGEHPQTSIEQQVDELLTLVGIDPRRKNEYPHQFSGGMKQRVVIAISIACSPDLIIADEPTTALDVTIQAQIMATLQELKERLGTSMILITHDLGLVAEFCDDVAIMYAGQIVESGTVEDIFTGDRHHPYTEGLFRAIPDLDHHARRLTPIEGMMPDPACLPDGCAFQDRCPKAKESCRTQQPTKAEVNGHMIQCHCFTEQES